MIVHPTLRGTWSLLFSLALVCGTMSLVQGQAELPPEIDSDGVQTLARGPVNEAFASPTVADPAPGLVVPKQPPADINEVPPEYQPEGQNVQWFPGYWAWDEDREDFIWISGVWRDPPPGKRWVPGYWAEVTGGFQWVAGFWIDEQVEEMEYLKPPPQSLEQGPSIASPGDNYFYIPGNWIYANNDYRWSAGYWAPYREDWVYVQPHWVWTPRGCIFVSGYYDWRLPSRGQIFAPVYFNPVVYQRPSYFYTPRCVINTSNLFVHLWVRDSYNHYYFGNYYGQTYTNRHFTPWCNYNARPRCYDPLLSFCNVHYHRQGINYSNRMQSWHTHYANNSHAHERPPITWRDQVEYDRQYRGKGPQNGQVRHTHLAQDLQDVIKNKTPERNWKRQDLAARDLNKSSIDQVKQLHKLRLDQEKVSLVSRDVPGRDLPGRELPGREGPGRSDPDRDGRPNRTPDLVDKPKGPALNPPGTIRPSDRDPSPSEKIVSAQEALKGKFRLPKTTVSANKPKIVVPETPEKSVVSIPNIKRPEGTGKPLGIGDKPNSLENPARVPGLRNPAAIAGPKPLDDTENSNPLTKPSTRPGLSRPGNSLPGNITNNNLPERKPVDTKPLTARDPVTPTKPTLSGTGSTSSSVQQKIEAIRQQQQDALNKARNPGNNPVGPNVNQNFGGKTYRGNEPPKVSVPAVAAPKRDTPTTTRQPLTLDRSNDTPRSLGASGASSAAESRIRDLQSRNSQLRGNLGGNVQPKVSQPTAPLQRPTVQVPQIQPRNNIVPRTNPQPQAGGKSGEKKRGR